MLCHLHPRLVLLAKNTYLKSGKLVFALKGMSNMGTARSLLCSTGACPQPKLGGSLQELGDQASRSALSCTSLLSENGGETRQGQGADSRLVADVARKS